MRKLIILKVFLISICFTTSNVFAAWTYGFETNILNKGGGAGTIEIVSTEKHSGSNSLEVSVTTPDTNNPWNLWADTKTNDLFQVEAGKSYILSFWAKALVDNHKINFGFNGADGQPLNADWSAGISKVIIAGDWALYEGAFSASRTTTVGIYMHCASEAGTFYIDDLSLDLSPMRISDPGFENRAWWIGGTPVNNSVSNSLGSLTYDNTISHSGNWSLKINTQNPGNAWDLMPICGSVALQKGKEYKVTFWARGDGDGSTRQLIAGCNGLGYFTIADEISWKKYTFTFVSNKTGNEDFSFQAGNSKGIVWVDDIEIQEIIIEPTLRPGYENNNILPANAGFEFSTNEDFNLIGTNSANFSLDASTSVEGLKSLKIGVNTPSPYTFWDIQLYNNTLEVTKDHYYVISFWAKADAVRPIDLKIADKNNNQWENGGKTINLSTEWKRYSIETLSNVTTSTNSGAILTLMFGRQAGNYWIDNMVVADMDTLNFPNNLPDLPSLGVSTQLQNGSFENGFANWQQESYSETQPQLIEQTRNNGTQALRLVTSSNSIFRNNVSQKLSFDRNKKYGISFWAKSNNRTYLKLNLTDNNQVRDFSKKFKLTNDWKRYEYKITMDASWNIEKDYANLIFEANHMTGIIDIDDVVVTNYETKPDVASTSDLIKKTFPSSGSAKYLVILVNFSDTETTYTQSNFNSLMNDPGYAGIGSFKDYYKEQSSNQLIVDATVVNWVKVSKPHKYYGENIWGTDRPRVRELVMEVVKLVDPVINFSDYDNDKDGVVDGICIVHQGQGEEFGGANPDNIWSQIGDIRQDYSEPFAACKFDNVIVGTYAIQPEIESILNSNHMSPVGVFCHEFGHLLGIPDFYDADGMGSGGKYLGTYDFDLMGSGSWNSTTRKGDTPAHLNPYSKIKLGWANSITLNQSVSIANMADATVGGQIYRIDTPTKGEYFLLENRQFVSFDAKIPESGLVIYHVDSTEIESNTASDKVNISFRQGLYIKQSTKGTHFTFPAIGNEFTDTSTPNSLTWNGLNTNKAITNIRLENAKIAFDFKGGSVNNLKNNEILKYNIYSNSTGIVIESNDTMNKLRITNIVGQTILNKYILSKSISIPIKIKGVYYVEVDGVGQKVIVN